jgi:hypothetical protein
MGQLARKVKPLPDQIHFPSRGGNRRFGLLLESVKHVHCLTEAGNVHRAIRPSRIVRANLPHSLREAMQLLCALVPLPDLCLMERKTRGSAEPTPETP